MPSQLALLHRDFTFAIRFLFVQWGRTQGTASLLNIHRNYYVEKALKWQHHQGPYGQSRRESNKSMTMQTTFSPRQTSNDSSLKIRLSNSFCQDSKLLLQLLSIRTCRWLSSLLCLALWGHYFVNKATKRISALTKARREACSHSLQARSQATSHMSTSRQTMHVTTNSKIGSKTCPRNWKHSVSNPLRLPAWMVLALLGLFVVGCSPSAPYTLWVMPQLAALCTLAMAPAQL